MRLGVAGRNEARFGEGEGYQLNTSLGKMPSACLVGGEPRCPGPWMPARMPLRQASVCLGRAVPLPAPIITCP